MNNFSLHHWNGSTWDEIKNLVFPVSFSDLLDERLDELFVTFYNSEQEQYKPTDIFIITLFEGDRKIKAKGFCAATDNVKELPLGSGNYKHELALIEPTKLAEGIMCQTLTFTNTLGKIYTENAKNVELTIPEELEGMYEFADNIALDDIYKDFDLGIKSPMDASGKLPSLKDIGDRMAQISNDKYSSISGTTIKLTDQAVYEGVKSQIVITSSDTTTVTDLTQQPTLKSGIYNISYKLIFLVYDEQNTEVGVVGAQYNFSLAVVSNRLPLLPYTITDVVCRCLELAEPLTASQTPRVIFDGVVYSEDGVDGGRTYREGSQAAEYSTVFAPELALTQANLREQLKSIGGYIHSEPRIVITAKTEVEGYTGPPIFKLRYDKIIGRTEANLQNATLVERGLSRSINEYNTELRVNASNIVNTLDYGQGVVTEPYVGGYRSLRCDLNTRASEDNLYAPTDTGIYMITRVRCGIKGDNDWIYEPVDITGYVLEKHSYDLLSDYESEMPNAKSLALYYTQGAEGIHGLYYRSTTVAIAQPWTKVAIVRILAREMDVTEAKIEEELIDDARGMGKLAMQISYIPIYKNMISHSKGKYIPNEIPFAQTFAQSDNVIETRYFGENLKGTAARLGNVEEERTYMFKSINDVPATGQTVGNYVISSVTTSFMPTYTKATLTLSKHFNKISEYVGIDSHKRVYEVSERESHERHILIKHKLVFGINESAVGGNADNTMGVFKTTPPDLISAAQLNTFTDDNGVSPNLLLPVISSAFGNALTFTFTTKDNYAAGIQIEHEEVGNISGYWAQDIPYADYYGRFEKANIKLFGEDALRDLGISNANSLPKLTSTPPNYTKASYSLSDLFIDKDSREHLTFTYEIEACTTDDDIIIGSGFASGNPLVNANPVKPLLYLYDKPFTEFSTNIADNDGTLVYKFATGGYTYTDGTLSFATATNIQTSNKYAYWVIAYPRYEDSVTEYQDKHGNKVTSSIYKGGEILLASKKPVIGGKEIHAPINVNLKYK